MAEVFNSLLLVTAYMMGSFSTAVWIGRWLYGIDVREYGSGNAGASNAYRILGPRTGIAVLLIDVLKGLAAVWMAYLPSLFRIAYFPPASEQFINLQLALGIAVLIGHVIPVFSGFRGGKGIATLLGVVIAVDPLAACYLILVFIAVLVFSKFVSLSSIAAALSFPVIMIGFFENSIPALNIFATFVPILVMITHQKNIERLLRREESKVKIFKKKKRKYKMMR
ncbi:MAG: glycerol-3-phosphate 1-O-acyltransferase PlsY [Bacteroidetes bacterium]|nr:glycerol-3-phosphate 1-O-acyltransferase PlsY [Bacteroidota bacterium]